MQEEEESCCFGVQPVNFWVHPGDLGKQTDSLVCDRD